MVSRHRVIRPPRVQVNRFPFGFWIEMDRFNTLGRETSPGRKQSEIWTELNLFELIVVSNVQ